MSIAKDGRRAPNKTQYVLGLRGDLSAREVVSRAREAGIELTEKYVYRIRSGARTRTDGESPRRASSKADFILEFPFDTSAKIVVAEAQKKGLTMSETYVYMVRAKHRDAAPRNDGLARYGSGAPAFRKLVLELGIAQSKALLADLERRLAHLSVD